MEQQCDICSKETNPVSELKFWEASQKKIYRFCSLECLKKMQKQLKKSKR